MVTFLSKNLLLIWGRAPGTTDLTLALLCIPPEKKPTTLKSRPKSKEKKKKLCERSLNGLREDTHQLL